MASTCFHCGESIPAGFSAQLEIKGSTESFCCYGCQAVAEVIVTDGLDNFYRHRTAMATRPDEIEESELAQLKLYDDPLLQEEFVQEHEGLKQTSLSVSGITCAACIWLLEREINRLDGIDSFSINHSTHKAFIEWRDPAKLSDVLLKARAIGYKVKPYRHHEAKLAAIREKRMAVFRIAIAGIAAMQNMMFSIPLYLGMYNELDTQLISLFRWVSMFMAAPVVLFSSYPFYQAAFRSLKMKRLSMDVPVSIAIVIAYVASSYTTISTVPTLESDVYFDSVSMFAFFLLLGRFIEMQTRHRYLNDDVDMDQLLPETASIVENGEVISRVSQRIESDDVLRVKQGEIVAADGVIIKGESRFDEAALTGEFLPIEKRAGSAVHAGTANMDNTVDIRVTAKPKESRLSSIVRLIGQAQTAKPATQTLSDNIASYFVALVLIACTGSGIFWSMHDPDLVFPIMLSVLVVTCPCALSLATPTALTGATSGLRRLGFLLTKNHALEAMSQADIVIFDKTGTLTEGKLEIVNIHTFSDQSERDAAEIASALESESKHPIAAAFNTYNSLVAEAIEHINGAGINGVVNGQPYILGHADYIAQSLPDIDSSSLQHKHNGPVVFLASDSELLARFDLSDTLRAEAIDAIARLRNLGKSIQILSGDQPQSVAYVADQIGVQEAHARQTPEQKLAHVEALQASGHKVVMVGDGINDLPVLSRADLSIAMGGASDLTKLNADAILLNEHLSSLARAFEYSKRTRKIIIENMSWALGYNICMLPLAMAGWVPPYFAALGMSLSSLIVVFNSMRLRK